MLMGTWATPPKRWHKKRSENEENPKSWLSNNSVNHPQVNLLCIQRHFHTAGQDKQAWLWTTPTWRAPVQVPLVAVAVHGSLEGPVLVYGCDVAVRRQSRPGLVSKLAVLTGVGAADSWGQRQQTPLKPAGEGQFFRTEPKKSKDVSIKNPSNCQNVFERDTRGHSTCFTTTLKGWGRAVCFTLCSLFLEDT